jgi:hypothetical protein
MKNTNGFFSYKIPNVLIRTTDNPARLMLKVFILLALGYLPTALHAVDDPAKVRTEGDSYFSYIELPCPQSDDKKREECFQNFKEKLIALKDCKSTSECPQGNAILKQLFGSMYRINLPDYLVYFQLKDGVFIRHQPVMMYKNKNTPYLEGVKNVYVLAFVEKKVCLGATISTDYRNEPNPFSGLFSKLGATTDAPAPKASESKPGHFIWYPLSGDSDEKYLWMAFARLPVDVNTTNRLTVRYVTPGDFTDEELKGFSGDDACKSAASSDKQLGKALAGEKDQTLQLKGTLEIRNTATNKKPQNTPKDDATHKYNLTLNGAIDSSKSEENKKSKLQGYRGEFLAANAFFSNSPANNMAMAFALGATQGTRNTTVSTGGSNVNINGYVLVKYMWTPPKLSAEPDSTRLHKSHGVFLGTNLTNNAFDEIVFGYAWGHLSGNAGALFGINSVNSKNENDQGRKIRLFIGLDYTL